MHWLVDHAGTVYLLLGIVALSLLAAFWLNRRVKFLGLAAGAFAVIALFWLLTRVVITDRKQIDQNVRTMADAVVAGDTNTLMKYVATNFRYKGMTRDQVEKMVLGSAKRFRVSEIVITNLQVPELSREARKAKVEFQATVHNPDGPRPFHLKTEFVLEEETWKIKTFAIFNALIEQPIDIPQ